MQRFISAFFVAALITATATAHAAPARPDTRLITQPDGTAVTARTVGDEFAAYTETLDGYTVVQTDAGAWAYAVLDDDGTLAPSAALAGIDPAPASTTPHLRPTAEQRPARAASMAILADSYQNPRTVPFTQDVLVIMVDFDDQPGQAAAADMYDLFFGSSNSVGDWFDEISGGQVIINPAATTASFNGITDWLTIGTAHPDCEQYNSSTTQWDTCVQGIASAAIGAADAVIDFSAYDSNSDGVLASTELATIIMVAGYEGAYSETPSPAVWAHRYYLPASADRDNVTIPASDTFGYAMFGEIHADSTTDPNAHTATIGVMIHELGHLVMHWFDLYDTDYSSAGLGNFDIMAGGTWCATDYNLAGNSPIHPGAFLKIWSGIYEEITGDDTGATYAYTGTTTPRALRVHTTETNEYFLAESRPPFGYDAGLQYCLSDGSSADYGLVISHVDEMLIENGCLATNDCNDDEAHKLVDIEEADGSQDLDASSTSRGSWLDIWQSGSTFSAASTPNSNRYDGAVTNVSIHANVAGDNLTVTLAPANAVGGASFTTGVTKGDETAPTTTSGSSSGGCSASGASGVPVLFVLAGVILALRRRRA